MITQMTTKWVTTKVVHDPSLVEDVMAVEDSLSDWSLDEKIRIIHEASGANVKDIEEVLLAYQEQLSPWVE